VKASNLEKPRATFTALQLRHIAVDTSRLSSISLSAWRSSVRGTFDEALMEANEHGFEYMVFNYLAPQERGGLEFYRALAEKLNTAGEKCRETGLRLCYDNHDFEFEPKSGGRPIETLLQRLDKSLVHLKIDAFWVSMAGENAATFIRQNASRVAMVHLKNRKPGAPRAFDIPRFRMTRSETIGSAI
jgi:sugar phosphate isomerase/epimerase